MRGWMSNVYAARPATWTGLPTLTCVVASIWLQQLLGEGGGVGRRDRQDDGGAQRARFGRWRSPWQPRWDAAAGRTNVRHRVAAVDVGPQVRPVVHDVGLVERVQHLPALLVRSIDPDAHRVGAGQDARQRGGVAARPAQRAGQRRQPELERGGDVARQGVHRAAHDHREQLGGRLVRKAGRRAGGHADREASDDDADDDWRDEARTNLHPSTVRRLIHGATPWRELRQPRITRGSAARPRVSG